METKAINLSPVEFANALGKLNLRPKNQIWCEKMDYKTAWWTCQNPAWLILLIEATSHLNPIANELVVCQLAREVVHLNADPRVLACIETREAWARGEASYGKRCAAMAAAMGSAKAAFGVALDVALDAAPAAIWAARAVAGVSMWDTARDSARATEWAAAGDSPWDAPWDAATAAATAAARSTMEAKQCKIIHELIPQPVLTSNPFSNV